MRLLIASLLLVIGTSSFGQDQLRASDTLMYFKMRATDLFAKYRNTPDSVLLFLDQAITAYPEDTLLVYNKGIFLMLRKKYSDALQVFSQIDDYLTNRGFSYLLGRVNYLNNNNKVAFTYFDNALQYADTKIEELREKSWCPGHECQGLQFQKVELLILLDRKKEAIDVLNSIELSPGDSIGVELINEYRNKTKTDIIDEMRR